MTPANSNRKAKHIRLLFLASITFLYGASTKQCSFNIDTSTNNTDPKNDESARDDDLPRIADLEETTSSIHNRLTQIANESSPGEWDTNNDGIAETIVSVSADGIKTTIIKDGIHTRLQTTKSPERVSRTEYHAGTTVASRTLVEEILPNIGPTPLSDTFFNIDGEMTQTTSFRRIPDLKKTLVTTQIIDTRNGEPTSSHVSEILWGTSVPTLLRGQTRDDSRTMDASFQGATCSTSIATSTIGGVQLSPDNKNFRILTIDENEDPKARCTTDQSRYIAHLLHEAISDLRINILGKVNTPRANQLSDALGSRDRSLFLMCGNCGRGEALIGPDGQHYGINLNRNIGLGTIDFKHWKVIDKTDYELDKTALFHELLHWSSREGHKIPDIQGQPGRPEEGIGVDWLNACGRFIGGCTTVDNIGNYDLPSPGTITFDCARCAENSGTSFECGVRIEEESPDVAKLVLNRGECQSPCWNIEYVNDNTYVLGGSPAVECMRPSIETCDRYPESTRYVAPEYLTHPNGLCASMCHTPSILPEYASIKTNSSAQEKYLEDQTCFSQSRRVMSIESPPSFNSCTRYTEIETAKPDILCSTKRLRCSDATCVDTTDP